LEKYVASHRNACTQLSAAAAHVAYHLQNERSHLQHMLNNIESSDPRLLAAISKITCDKDVPSLLDNLEGAAVLLQEACSVAQRLSGNKRVHISAVSSDVSSQVDMSALQSGIGPSGVHFRFYDNHEYRKLNKAQKKELMTWRDTPSGRSAVAKGKASRKSGRPDANVSSLVEKEVARRLKTLTQAPSSYCY